MAAALVVVVDREERRRQAMALLEAGWTQAQVARYFVVSREAVRKWRTRFLVGGSAGLAARPRGRPPRRHSLG